MKYLIDLYTREIKEVNDETFDNFVHGVGANRGKPIQSTESKVGTVYGGLNPKTGNSLHPTKIGLVLYSS